MLIILIILLISIFVYLIGGIWWYGRPPNENSGNCWLCGVWKNDLMKYKFKNGVVNYFCVKCVKYNKDIHNG